MRVLITGSGGTLGDIKIAVALSGFSITELVSGTEGVDLIAEEFARQRKIPITRFAPNKEAWPQAHYKIRNGCMTCYAEALIALRVNPISTESVIISDIYRCMKELGKAIYIHAI